MKAVTDFDALLIGLSPEESRQFHRLLRDWGRGDESSFPVQLALLTRLQWKAAGEIPKSIEDQRKLLESAFSEARDGFRASTGELLGAIQAQTKALQVEAAQQSVALRECALATAGHLEHADRVAIQIREALNRAQHSWEVAQSEFQAERARLQEFTTSLQTQLGVRDRALAILTALLLVALGIGAGLVLAWP